MPQRYGVRITLTSQLGKCPNGHRVGDQWVVTRKTPEGICLGAFASILPSLTALRFGASFPWERREGEAIIGCPDPNVVNTFHLERFELDDGE